MNETQTTQKDPVKERAKLIEHMLSEVETALDDRGTPNHFINSIREQFDATQRLTDKQVEGLRKWYANV